MKRPHRGNWRPGQTNGALLIVQVVTLALCAIRGLDYLRPDNDPSSVLSRVQDSAPLQVWGLGFVTAAVLGVIALAGRWGWLLAVAHCAAMVFYAMIAYGLFLSTELGPGVRTPAGLAGTAVIHGALGLGILTILRRDEIAEEMASEPT